MLFLRLKDNLPAEMRANLADDTEPTVPHARNTKVVLFARAPKKSKECGGRALKTLLSVNKQVIRLRLRP